MDAPAPDRLIGFVRLYGWTLLILGWARMGLADWVEQKIRHRLLAVGVVLCLLGYLPLAGHTLLGLSGRGTGWLVGEWWTGLGLHLAISAAAAVSLWFLRVWPAGDVKLFVLLAATAPLARLPKGFHGGTLFLETLINVFLPAAAYLFLTAAFYLWRTRFAHQAEFLRQVGARRVLPFLRAKLDEAWVTLKKEKDEWVEAYRDPRRLLVDASLWLLSMGAMSVVSYYIGERLGSPVVKTLVTFGLFFLWSRFAMTIGKPRALALVTAFFVFMTLRGGTPDWGALSMAFRHISVFSLCIFFGIQIAMKIAAGQTGFAVLPFLFMIPSLLPWREMRDWAARTLWGALPSAPSLPSTDGSLATWALMGLFFGLSLVFVRIWDEESYQSLTPGQILPRMTLGPRIVAAIEADGEFAGEFGAFYADGLTEEQVVLLREWCEANEIESVPLAPTISFANWVYLGYFLTVVLDGHVLRSVY